MISRNQLTFLVAGPLHEVGLSCVPIYLELGSVIISSWTDQDISKLNLLGENLKRVKVVLGSREGIEDYKTEPYDNVGNSLLQCMSCLNGLLNCETEYAIKVRGDEYLPKWDTFLAKMASGKFVHSNRFSRKAAEPYHLGDTFFGGRTEILRNAMLRMREMALNNHFKDMKVCGQKRHLSAEQKITISIIQQLEPDFPFNECHEIIRRHFDICPLSEMGDFKINSSGWKRDGLPNPRSDFNSFQWGCIDSLAQL